MSMASERKAGIQEALKAVRAERADCHAHAVAARKDSRANDAEWWRTRRDQTDRVYGAIQKLLVP